MIFVVVVVLVDVFCVCGFVAAVVVVVIIICFVFCTTSTTSADSLKIKAWIISPIFWQICSHENTPTTAVYRSRACPNRAV